jgi:flagellar basal-body rod protein FlgB
MVQLFSGDTYRATRMGLDACALRHQVISNNIANADTPQYRDRVVSFEDQLRAQLMPSGDQLVGRRTRAGQIPIGESAMAEVNATVGYSPAVAWRVDGNTVDIDLEVTRLTENQSKYKALARVMADEHRLLRTAISGSAR